MAENTPLKWIQEQGGWSSAKVLLDTYGHIMPTESRGFADRLAAVDGTNAAQPESREESDGPGGCQDVAESMGYGDTEIDVTPRSPIMHIGDLLAFDPAQVTIR